MVPNKMNTLNTLTRKNQQGAVWVEFLVVASTLLISLFILIPTLAKYMDIRHKTEQVAQYSTWERTVWYKDKLGLGAPEKPEADLIGQANHRVLADADTLIFSGQNSGVFKVDSFHNFVDSKDGTANYTSLLARRGESPEDSLSGNPSVDNNSQPGANIVDDAVAAADLLTNIDGVINLNGYYKSTASVTVKQPSWLPAFISDNITMSASKSILVDGWSAGGKTYVQEQVNKLQPKSFTVAPKAALEVYRDAYNNPLLRALNLTNDLGDLDFDHVDTDALLDPDNQLGEFY